MCGTCTPSAQYWICAHCRCSLFNDFNFLWISLDFDADIDDHFYDIDPDINHFNTLYSNMSEGNTCKYYEFNDFNTNVMKSRNDLSAFHSNICSLLNNWDELLHFSKHAKYFIWYSMYYWILDQRRRSPRCTVYMPGYVAFHLHRDGRGGGISVYVRMEFCSKNWVSYAYRMFACWIANWW